MSLTNIYCLLHSIDWAEDRTWSPSEDTGDVSTSEEEETIEEDSDYDDSDDEDYKKWSKQNLCLEASFNSNQPCQCGVLSSGVILPHRLLLWTHTSTFRNELA